MINTRLSPSELALLAITGFGAMQKQEELKALLIEIDKLSPKIILEIGVGKGGTSWAWSKFSCVEEIIAIDMPFGPWGGGPTEASIDYIQNNTHAKYDFIPAASLGFTTIKFIEKTLDNKAIIDFLFIDGDHSYEGVKADYEKYSPFVRKGGLIAFHDICKHSLETGCEVQKFWHELTNPLDKKGYSSYESIIRDPPNWGGIGLIRI